MKYYAVRVGRECGVFNNWAACQESINGYSGAEYKTFTSEEEAKAYLENKDLWRNKIEKDIKDGFVVAFCDGSFSEKSNKYSYGVVMIDHEMNETTLCGYGSNEKYIETRNIIGEVFGSINSMDWAVSNGYNKLKIYHDYEGISKWINGEWGTKSDVAKMYKSIYSAKYEDILNVEFYHVKGHSNNRYNEMADSIAKKALNDGKVQHVMGENWFVIPYVDKDGFETVINALKEDCPTLSVTSDEQTNKTVFKLVLDKDKITATAFDNASHKLVIQGKPSFLFQMIISHLTEQDKVKNVDAVMGSVFRKTINKESIDEKFNKLFPAFPEDYPQGIKKLLRQSLINKDYRIESDDYSQYAFPAFRALEGHIRYLHIKATGKPVKGVFTTFNRSRSTGKYVLTLPCIDPSKKPLIEECYNYYKNYRDRIFHFGDIIGTTDNTSILTAEQADEAIQICFKLIKNNI